MWVLSSNGIYVVPVDEMIANEGISPLFYNKHNGLPSVANANSYSALTDEGDLYIAGASGVVRVNIEKSFEDLGNIKMAVPYIEVDVKVTFPDKNGKLDDEEFRLIKSHPALGGDALREITIMPELAVGAESHHERPDGKGYPKGLKEGEIPRVAQIIAVADTFDAIYSDRPYRKRMNFEKVVSIMKEVSGTQLTSDVVDAFLRLVDKGVMRAEDDHGGGTTDDIDNIHRKFENEEKNGGKE